MKDVNSSMGNSVENHKPVIFLSPPWGGPNYQKESVWSLSDNFLQGSYNMNDVVESCLKRGLGNRIVVFLPRNSDIDEIKFLPNRVWDCGSKEEAEMGDSAVDYLFMDGYCRGICVYLNINKVRQSA